MPNTNNIKHKTVSGIIWKFIGVMGTSGVSFIVSIFLARLLEPEAYGTISLVTVITSILNIFITPGLATSLVQKKDATDIDYSTAFLFTLGLSIVLYAGIYTSAPYIAKFYGIIELTPVFRVLGITLLLSPVSIIQYAYITKHMQFKKNFFVSFISTIVSGTVGITMAYNGFGIWALVGSNLSSPAVAQLINWIVVPWRPKLDFSINRLKPMIKFGWKMLAVSFIDTLYNNIRSLIIGKRYSANDLAYYNKGKQFPFLIISNINLTIDSVLFPALSTVQENKNSMKGFLRRSIKTSTYILAPMLVGLACVSEPLVKLVLTEKWLFAVPYMRIFCITYIFYPIHSANLQAIKAVGRSDIVLVQEFIKKGIGITSVLITMWISVRAMAMSLLFTTVLSLIVNVSPCKKLFDYGLIEQIKDVLPGIIMSIAMAVAVLLVGMVPISSVVIRLIVMVLTGVIVYIGGSLIFKVESFKYLLTTIKETVGKN